MRQFPFSSIHKTLVTSNDNTKQTNKQISQPTSDQSVVAKSFLTAGVVIMLIFLCHFGSFYSILRIEASSMMIDDCATKI